MWRFHKRSGAPELVVSFCFDFETLLKREPCLAEVAICLPWTLTLLAYTLMHWSYPRDMRLLNERRKTAQDVGSPVPAV